MDEMDVTTRLEWEDDTCTMTRGQRTLKVSFPASEQFIAVNALSGKEYPIPRKLRRHLKGMPVIDIGAHVGTTVAYWIIELEPNEVWAYEPDPRSHSMLLANSGDCSRLGVAAPVVTCDRRAVGRETELRDLYLADSPCLSSIVRSSQWCKTRAIERVETLSGVDVLRRVKGPIGVLKIDAEEAEAEILESMKPELHRVRMIYVEHHGEDLRRDVDRILEEAGFLLVHANCQWTRGVLSYVHKDLALELYDAEDLPNHVPSEQLPTDVQSQGDTEMLVDVRRMSPKPPYWTDEPVAPNWSDTPLPEPRCAAATAKQPQFKLMFARFPGGGVDRKEVTDWLIRAVLAAKADPRIDDDIRNWSETNTPITMTRNKCVEVAKREGVDFVVMVDNDMSPDLYLPENFHREYSDPRARPFFQSSFDFAIKQRIAGEPCCIAAPYCGPPPHENMYVFHWRREENDRPSDEADMILDQYAREHAANMRGIQEAAALPTGLILIDMKCLDYIDPPYFYYEWDDETESKKASTEDVTFTRNLSLNGCPQFCNWDAWAGHFKTKCVGRPKTLSARSLNWRFRKRVLQEYNIASPEEELLIIKPRNGHGQKEAQQKCG